MKPERAFKAERALAAHCPELLRKGPSPDELLPLLGRMGERLARRLAGALAPLLGGEAPGVSCSSPREGDLAMLRSGVATLAANSLFGVGPGAAPLLVSIEAEPVLRIVDTAFGGKGEAPCPLPTAFPMAAELMIGRIEGLLASHISAAVAAITATITTSPATFPGRALAAEPPAIAPLRRDGSLALLSPFAEHTPLAILTLEVEDGSVLPWLVTLAMPLGTLARLFGYPDTGPTHASTGAAPRRAGSPTTGACAGIPLSLRAVVVDMPISFATLATLEPGQILPVSVARRVPLRIGEHTIAHGTPGALDEHIAIQITDAF
jgi:flagellar motor switch protein FliM